MNLGFTLSDTSGTPNSLQKSEVIAVIEPDLHTSDRYLYLKLRLIRSKFTNCP